MGCAAMLLPGRAALADAAPRRFAAVARFAAADWGAAETLLAAGIVPVAMAETALYRQWLPEIALPAGVVDLGSRVEPNLELLAALRPDRIFVSNWQASLAGRLRRIAPVETVAIVGGGRSPFDNAVAALVRAGRMGGPAADARASAYRRDFARDLAAFAGRLAGRALPPLLIGVLHENGSQLFVYGPGSWVHEILVRLGLRNALRRPTSAYGNALIDLSQLAGDPDAALLYLDQGDRTRRAERRLRTSTLWRRLPMVEQGRVTAIPPFYALGGVPSMRRCARVVAEALLDPRRRADDG